MTEKEWLECTDPQPMLEFLPGRASDRKFSDRKVRLFVCAFTCRVRPILTDKRSLRAIEASEQYADGLISGDDLRTAWMEARDAAQRLNGRTAECHAAWTAERATHSQAQSAAGYALIDPLLLGLAGTQESWNQEVIALLRDIVGNPFRPVAIDPVWLTPTVTALAAAIYEERAFDRLPVLADALEEAGCTDTDILNHLRLPGVHVRGCWPLDLILGRE